MNWYKKSKTIHEIQKGDRLNYNYPKAPYKGYCIVDNVNADGTIDVIDHTGRIMRKMPLKWDNFSMFKEIQ